MAGEDFSPASVGHLVSARQQFPRRGWHLLRHTFASRAAQAGVPIPKLSAWMGHKSIATTMIYAHLAPGYDADIERV